MYPPSPPPQPTRKSTLDSVASGSSMNSSSSYASYETGVTTPDLGTFAQREALRPGLTVLLPCEFWKYTGCPETFPSDDMGEWINHHAADHMRNALPSRLRCPICNHRPFVAAERGDDALQFNFEQRMTHWASHYTERPNHRFSMRPDYDMAKHLHRKHIISNEVYDLAMRSELPDTYAAPVAQLTSPGWVPPRNRREDAYREAVRYDLKREERERRGKHRKR